MIIGFSRFSPEQEGWNRDPPIEGSDLPELRQGSDLIWGRWAMSAGSGKANLHYWVAAWITHWLTPRIIKQALDSKGETLKPWPGTKFEPNTDAGAALIGKYLFVTWISAANPAIGSPNGRGLAYLLVQHKAELGNLRITEVTVFQSEGQNGDASGKLPCMVFKIEKCPES